MKNLLKIKHYVNDIETEEFLNGKAILRMGKSDWINFTKSYADETEDCIFLQTINETFHYFFFIEGFDIDNYLKELIQEWDKIISK